MVEKERVFEFLNGLNCDLDDVRGRILRLKPLPNVFRRDEERRKLLESDVEQ